MTPVGVPSEERRDRWEVRVLDPNPCTMPRALQSVRCWRSALGLCDGGHSPGGGAGGQFPPHAVPARLAEAARGGFVSGGGRGVPQGWGERCGMSQQGHQRLQIAYTRCSGSPSPILCQCSAEAFLLLCPSSSPKLPLGNGFCFLMLSLRAAAPHRLCCASPFLC